jgi:hypothetical protein
VRRATAAAALLLALAVGCSGDDDAAPAADASSAPENDALCLYVDRRDEPVVDLIEPAIELAATLYESEPEFFEISADRQRVSLVVAGEGTASQVFYCGEGGYVPATSLGEASGATFTGDAVDFDADAIFDQLDDELDDPDIADFAMIGDGDGGVVYDATVQSSAGGILLVTLSPAGSILAVQPQ